MKMQVQNDQRNDDDAFEWGQGGYLPHPPGIHGAALTEFGPKTIKDLKTGQEARKLELVFVTSAKMEDGEPYRISCLSAPSLNAAANVCKYLEAVGAPVAELRRTKDKPKLSEYIGKPVTLVISNTTREDGSVKDHIDSFLPYQKKAKTAKPAAPTTPPPSFDDDEE